MPDIHRRSESQSPSFERRRDHSVRFLYQTNDLNKRSKSAPPGDRSKPTNIDPLPIDPHIRAKLEYKSYRAIIDKTP